jgi:hypothetical protein
MNPKYFYREEENVPYNKQTRTAWFEDFVKSLASNQEVQVASATTNMTDYIASIMGEKRKNATVAEVVNQYQELTGLKSYLQSIYHPTIKQAQDASAIFANVKPDIKEKILAFVKNRVEAYKGFVSILAIQEELLNSFRADGLLPQDVYDRTVSEYLFQQIEQEKSKHPNNENTNLVGKRWHDSFEDEGANNDFFHNLEPKT